MADLKLTDIQELSEAPHEDDVVHIVDVSDTTEDASGSSFKIKTKNFFSKERASSFAYSFFIS